MLPRSNLRSPLFLLTAPLSIALILAGGFVGCAPQSGVSSSGAVELLNVSYDPTRELWRDLNKAFIQHYQEANGKTVAIRASHGGSGSQARSVIDGLQADVVTLSMWTDTDMIRRQGLIQEGWEDKFPNRSLPYSSTIVFVVRKGNPKGIHDWRDLERSDVSIITPNPKVSGNGKLSFLAAWGAVVLNGGTEAEAEKFVSQLYQKVPVLDTGARAATITFAEKGIGDVHLTWENEAYLEVEESKGKLEIVYPSLSIRAEPHIAVVDEYVDQRGTRQVAEDYLNFLYTDAGQEIIGKHFYRPNNPDIAAKYAGSLREIKLFSITDITQGWDDAQTRFFGDNGVFDRIYAR